MPRNIGNIKPCMRCPYGKKPRQIPSTGLHFPLGCEVELTKAAMSVMDKRGLKLLPGKQIFIHSGIQSLGLRSAALICRFLSFNFRSVSEAAPLL